MKYKIQKVKTTGFQIRDWNDKLRTHMSGCLDTSNELWYKATGMSVILSVPCLLASITLLSFQKQEVVFNMPLAITTWILFVLAIVFGMTSFLQGADFFNNRGEEANKQIQKNKKVTGDFYSNEDEYEIEIITSTSDIVYTNIFYGIVSNLAFIFAIVNTGFFLVLVKYPITCCAILITNILLFVFFMFLFWSHFKSRV